MRYKRQSTLRLQIDVNPAGLVKNGRQLHLDQTKLRQNPACSVKNRRQLPLNQSKFRPNPACSVKNRSQLPLDQSKFRQNPACWVKNCRQIPLDQSKFTQHTLTIHSGPVFVCSSVPRAAARMFSEENSGGCGASETRFVIYARQTEIT